MLVPLLLSSLLPLPAERRNSDTLEAAFVFAFGTHVDALLFALPPSPPPLVSEALLHGIPGKLICVEARLPPRVLHLLP